MSPHEETRRTGKCGRASEVSLGRDAFEYSPTPENFQALWLVARFDVGAAHARVIAEHAFARRPAR